MSRPFPNSLKLKRHSKLQLFAEPESPVEKALDELKAELKSLKAELLKAVQQLAPVDPPADPEPPAPPIPALPPLPDPAPKVETKPHWLLRLIG